MKSRTRVGRVRLNGLLVALISAAILFGSSCKLTEPYEAAPTNDLGELNDEAPRNDTPRSKITGEVEIVWKGGNGQDTTAADDGKRAFLSIVAFEPTAAQPGHGVCTYTVTDDSATTVRRQITIALEGSIVDEIERKAWYRGVVVADTRGCGGGPDGGHDDGCTDHSGGCDEDHDHTDGGCTDGGHDDGHDDGCAGGSGGGCAGGSGGSGGAAVSGRSCRIGQVFAGKAHDGGTPGVASDGITWKWYDPDDSRAPLLGDLSTWHHMCRKTIVAGNIVVHTGARGRIRIER